MIIIFTALKTKTASHGISIKTLRACSPYRSMKSTTTIPQNEANIEKKPIDDNHTHWNFGCWISNLGRGTIVINDVFPHWLSPAN